MQHQELEPPAELRHAIRGFWYLERDFDEEGSGFEVLPDGHAEIIFHFGSGCSIMRDGKQQVLPSPFMVGLLGQPVHFYAKNRLYIIGIKCFPWAVFDLLDLPSVKGAIQAIEHPVAQLQDKLNALVIAGQVSNALTCVKDWFMQAHLAMAPNSMLFKAGAAMRRANGNLPVSEVASAAHATVRTLERNFKQSSGHTVKDVAGLMRFEQARDRLWCYPDTGIAGLAHELGYADQSHLNREFKRYSGTTAAAFARAIKQWKQNAGDDFVGFVIS
jgi:AraC-like DNA-binding protein